MEIWRWKC